MTDRIDDADLTSQERGKRAALASFLGLPPETLRLNEYDRNLWTVNPRMVRQGTGPTEAARLVATVREALAKLGTLRPFISRTDNGAVIGHEYVPGGPSIGDTEYCRECHLRDVADCHRGVDGADLSYDDLRAIGYDTLARMLRENPDSAPMLSLGFHDVVNTLYFLSAETDSHDSAQDHRDLIRATFRGEDVEDTRPFREVNDGEYLVLTETERETEWDERLESYIEDAMEIPEAVKPYFDREKWKRDARADGAGVSLASYDHAEHFVTFDGDDEADAGPFYVYRTN